MSNFNAPLNISGKETGCVLTAGKPQKPKSLIVWRSSKPIWDRDWLQLAHDFRYWDAPWHLPKKIFLKNVFVGLVKFMLSLFDIVFDYQLGSIHNLKLYHLTVFQHSLN